jgi:hypothetical protein
MSDGIVIFAAGNHGNNNFYYPGAYEPVLAVAATTHKDTKASYSNFAPWINISAPGGETLYGDAAGVLSCITEGSYMFAQGTSMAAPHVSGVAALLVSHAARNAYVISRQEVWDLLINNTDDIYDVNPTLIGFLGSGRLNAYKALLAATDLTADVPNPKNTTATPISPFEIELNWLKNDNNHAVMILSNMTNEFGRPEEGTAYQVGELLSEGGEIIYLGNAETFIHTELVAATTYFYRFFSYNENYEYSMGIGSQATTLCYKVEHILEDFEAGIDYCWEQERVAGNSSWRIGKGNSSNNPNHAYEGEYNIYIKADASGNIGNITHLILPPIDMAGFDNVKLRFALHNQTSYGLTDELSIYYRRSASKNWNLWKVYANNQNTWRLDSITLPETVDTEELQICFQSKINGGHGICLDNISVERFIGVGVKEHNLSSKITVYPNPTMGELRITNYELGIMGVEVFDVYGRKLVSQKSPISPETVINISHLAAGIYFLKIGGETVKVVKQ